ncbi:hypothetical protein LQW54_008226 [Pestalotiopsis sp. IQ-011]
MGRPFAIADRDIDVPLPLDIDESCEDVEALAKAAASTGIQTPNSPMSKSTSMTGFIYICQLRKLESSIQQTVHRVDDSEQITEAEIEQFLHRLQDWKSNITERWPGARKYRDVYESIKQIVLDSIEEGQYESRRAITSLRLSLHAALSAIDHHDNSQGEYTASSMVTEMAGGPMAPDLKEQQMPTGSGASDTPGTQSHFNMMLPLELQEPDGFTDTLFATPTSDWMTA